MGVLKAFVDYKTNNNNIYIAMTRLGLAYLIVICYYLKNCFSCMGIIIKQIEALHQNNKTSATILKDLNFQQKILKDHLKSLTKFIRQK